MKNFTKALSVLLCALLVSASFATEASNTQVTKHTESTEQVTKGQQWLFVLEASKATIIKGQGGCLSLHLAKADTKSVLKFSDRPYRLASVITVSELEKIWAIGGNSFAKDPPNAVIVSRDDTEAVVVILKQLEKTKDTWVFHFSYLDASKQLSKESLGSVALFIDDEIDCGCAPP